jgi:hypothetical protein
MGRTPGRALSRHVLAIARARGRRVDESSSPFANDRLEDNLNPIGPRFFYSASTTLCTPASLSQEVGLALGAQAGEARLTAVLKAAGFKRVRKAAQTPFNIVLEARS